ncbi:hypothetical protein BG011_002374 [Mortierella polycephala]|uniref:Uncharacterized protein n=1 Tax=Mortierella polycephala TaxID=41804 RepID=A0A9P6U4X5_9FUNG|nr:hypothetical protein BG011_002374 [Mortierella polycephala]
MAPNVLGPAKDGGAKGPVEPVSIFENDPGVDLKVEPGEPAHVLDRDGDEELGEGDDEGEEGEVAVAVAVIEFFV